MLPEKHINNSPDNQAEEKIVVDFDAAVEVEDSTADVNIAAPLPSAGIYPVKWNESDQEGKGLDGRMTKPKVGQASRAFVGGNIVGKIVATGEDYDEMPVYEYLNSLTMRGKPTSDLHHLLNCAGAPAPNKTTVRELLTFAKNVLEQSPAVYTELDWRAQYQDANGDWQTAVKSMEKFPLIDDPKNPGQKIRSQEYPSPLDGEPLKAQLYVRAFYTEAVAKEKMAKAK